MTEMEYKDANRLTAIILNCAYRVHSNLGPGLFENVYEAALEYELKVAGIKVDRQVSFPVVYEGIEMKEAYRIDLLIDDKVIVELKSVKEIEPIHQSQVITYLRLTNKPIGLLINFNTVLLKDGIKRCYYNRTISTEDEYYE
ncbi:MAG: GxxExxY protein [Bacteroidales bacterium]